MSLTRDEVKNVADLARLDLTDDELAAMTRQLGSILDYVAQLQQLDVAGVEPLAHALEVQNVFREDEPAPSLPVDEALANAPERRTTPKGEHFYAVPAVLESIPSQPSPAAGEGQGAGPGGEITMPPGVDLTGRNAADLAADLSAGDLSAETLTGQFLQIIRRRDPQVRAFLHVDEADALAQARAVDAKRQRGEPLGFLARPARRH